MRIFRPSITVIVTCICAAFATAQTPEISLGPQVSLFGVGASASVGFGNLFSISGELGFLPIKSFDVNIEEDVPPFSKNVYRGEPDVFGALLGVHVHPMGGNFTIGAGVLFGKYNLDAELISSDDTIEIGGTEYELSEVGTFTGKMRLEGTWPAFMVGWRGEGFNFGLGVALAKKPTIELSATGPVAQLPDFQADVDREVDDWLDEFNYYVIPLLRIGWQFGLGTR